MGSRNNDYGVNELADRVVTNLKQIRDSSLEFFEQALFVKNGDYWDLPGGFQLRDIEYGVDVYKVGEYLDTFSSKRSATAWCILVINKKREESRLLRYYDTKKSFLENSIHLNKKCLAQCGNQEDSDVVSARLTDDYQKMNSSIKQIDKFVNLAKYFQIRGFNHETF